MRTVSRRLPAMILATQLLVPPLWAAPPIPLDHFARLPEFNDAVLSPDGRYVAVGVPDGSQTNLAVIRLSDMKVTAAIRGGRDTHIAEINWASAERVIVEMADSSGPLDQPARTGELMAVNADGSRMDYLFGWRSPTWFTGRLSRNVTSGFGQLVSALRHDDNHVLVSSVSPREVWLDTARATLYRLDVHSAETRIVARAPIEGFSTFVVDDEGRVRFAFAEDKKTLKTRTFRRSGEDGWVEIGGTTSHVEIEPLRVSGDGQRVFVRARTGDAGRYCLAELDQSHGELRTLSCNEVADLDRALFSVDGNVALAAMYQPDRVVYDWLAPEHPEAVALRKAANSFPDQAVVPTSRTLDGSKVVFVAFSDRNPGDFYLYDTKSGKAQYLFSSRSWIDPAQMAERRPVQFASRDGASIRGYLTLPPGGGEKNLPLVVYPHGGPFGVRDDWSWDADAQALASRGYAVLQVNYRGSGGYGRQHYEAARGQWGTMMIDDITDGARWAIAQGVADKDRMCIYGGSYGGYASLMSAVREPDLYRCAIGYVGVYDIRSWMKDTDVKEWQAGRNYMRQYIGSDPDELAAQSPITHLDRLKVPVFVVHGRLDQRVPYGQATQLREALEERGRAYEWMVKSDEGHGFYRVEARTELYERMLAFLEKHIGKSESQQMRGE